MFLLHALQVTCGIISIGLAGACVPEVINAVHTGDDELPVIMVAIFFVVTGLTLLVSVVAS